MNEQKKIEINEKLFGTFNQRFGRTVFYSHIMQIVVGVIANNIRDRQ